MNHSEAYDRNHQAVMHDNVSPIAAARSPADVFNGASRIIDQLSAENTRLRRDADARAKEWEEACYENGKLKREVADASRMRSDNDRLRVELDEARIEIGALENVNDRRSAMIAGYELEAGDVPALKETIRILTRDHAEMAATLTSAQTGCTRLLDELRGWRHGGPADAFLSEVMVGWWRDFISSARSPASLSALHDACHAYGRTDSSDPAKQELVAIAVLVIRLATEGAS